MIISYFKFKLSEDSTVSNFNARRYNMIEFATIKNGTLPFKNKQGQIDQRMFLIQQMDYD